MALPVRSVLSNVNPFAGYSPAAVNAIGARAALPGWTNMLVPQPSTFTGPGSDPTYLANLAQSRAAGSAADAATVRQAAILRASTAYPRVNLPQPNASGIIQIPRSTEQGTAIQQAWGTNTGNQNQVNQSLTDFTKNYLASQPTAQGYNNSESAAIGKFYGTGPGSVSGDLSAIEQRRANSINQAAQGAIQQASRANTLRRMGTGNNSSNDRSYAQSLMGIAADAAQQQTANDASNYRYVADNQRNLAGVRQKMLNDLMMRDLAPADAALSFQGRGLQNLGALSNLQNSNTIYDDTALRRQQLLNSLIA